MIYVECKRSFQIFTFDDENWKGRSRAATTTIVLLEFTGNNFACERFNYSNFIAVDAVLVAGDCLRNTCRKLERFMRNWQKTMNGMLLISAVRIEAGAKILVIASVG